MPTNTDVEFCGGCELTAPAYPAPGHHPIGGVVRDTENDTWMVVPVCDGCYEHPERRRHTLKAHFFPRRQAEEDAVKHAGSTNIGG